MDIKGRFLLIIERFSKLNRILLIMVIGVIDKTCPYSAILLTFQVVFITKIESWAT